MVAVFNDFTTNFHCDPFKWPFSFLNKACQSDFEEIHTLYGNCYRFHPKETDQFLAPFGRQAGLSLILSFNESDWTSGWNHLLKGQFHCSKFRFISNQNFSGATLFMTPDYEETLDPDDSITLNPNEIPLVTFRKRISHKLGPPYGNEVNLILRQLVFNLIRVILSQNVFYVYIWSTWSLRTNLMQNWSDRIVDDFKKVMQRANSFKFDPFSILYKEVMHVWMPYTQGLVSMNPLHTYKSFYILYKKTILHSLYTLRQTMCSLNQEKIEEKCKCKSILFPTRVNSSNYEIPTCSFVKAGFHFVPFISSLF